MAKDTARLPLLQRLLPVFARSPKGQLRSSNSREYLLSQFTSDNWPFGMRKTAAGQTVTQATALSIPAFYRGVQIISDSLASLQLGVEQVGTDGNITKLPDHPLNTLLSNPSPRYSKYTLKSTMQAYALMRGNGYGFINRNAKGEPTEIRIIAPENCKPKLNDLGQLRYIVTEKQKTEVVEFSDMIHIPNLVLGEDHIEGISAISAFANALGLPLAMQEWMGKTMADGSPIQGLLSTDSVMSKEQIELAAQQWKDQLAKAATPILPGGLKYQGVSLSPEDMLFVDNYKLTVEDISRILGVPLHMLSSLDKATFSNIEEQGREFVTYTMRPWVKRWEPELTRKLVTEKDQKKGIRVRFNLDSMLRGSTAAQGEFLSKMVLNGVMSRNEARQYIGLNSKDGLDDMPLPVQFQQNNSNEQG